MARRDTIQLCQEACKQEMPDCLYSQFVKMRAQGLTTRQICLNLGIPHRRFLLQEALLWIERGMKLGHRAGKYTPKQPKEIIKRRRKRSDTKRLRFLQDYIEPLPDCEYTHLVNEYRDSHSLQEMADRHGLTRQSISLKLKKCVEWLEAGAPYPIVSTPIVPDIAFANRTARVLWLLRLLSKASEPVSGHDLAARFRTAERTIERDLRLMRKSGVSIVSKAGYHALGKHVILPLR